MPLVASSIIAFAGKHWRLILGGLALAVLGLMLVFARADARHWHKVADERQAALTLEIAKHKITLASVATCTNALDQQSKSVLALKAESDKRQADAAEAVRIARRASLDAETRARGLEASAGANRAERACVGSAAYLAAKDGL